MSAALTNASSSRRSSFERIFREYGSLSTAADVFPSAGKLVVERFAADRQGGAGFEGINGQIVRSPDPEIT